MDGVRVHLSPVGPVVLKGAHRNENLIAMEIIRRLSVWFFGCERDWDLEFSTEEGGHSDDCVFVVRLIRATLTGNGSHIRNQLDCHEWKFWLWDRKVKIFNSGYLNLPTTEAAKMLIEDMRKVVGETEATSNAEVVSPQGW